MNKKYLKIEKLSVSENLAKFINKELLSGTKISKKKFWKGFDKYVHELAPQNKKLIDTNTIILRLPLLIERKNEIIRKKICRRLPEFFPLDEGIKFARESRKSRQSSAKSDTSEQHRAPRDGTGRRKCTCHCHTASTCSYRASAK